MSSSLFARLGPMSAPLFVAPFALVVGVVAFVHEFGHLLVGRWFGVKAEIFSVVRQLASDAQWPGAIGREKLTQIERSEIAKKAAAARWK